MVITDLHETTPLLLMEFIYSFLGLQTDTRPQQNAACRLELAFNSVSDSHYNLDI